MKTSIIPSFHQPRSEDKADWLDKLSRKLVMQQLRKIEHGEIIVREEGQEYSFGKMTEAFPIQVHIDVHHHSVWSDVAFGGSSGSGEAYIKGSWSCSELVDLVRIFLRNRHVLHEMDNSTSRLQKPVHKMMHWLRRNTRTGSRRNIQAHYDLGNDFFRLFLDPTMMYSCAIYENETSSLDEAAVNKLDHICRKLEITPDDHVLEIGTGWGGFAIHAATHYGCKVTTTTISKEQFDLASAKVKEAGLEDKITLLFQDYRDLTGRYDKVVSIEMIEAIGHQYMDTYFSKCNELLKPNGKMLLQAITIKDQQYKYALKQVDYIKKFIFPGGFLPSISAISQSISTSTRMRIAHLEDIGPHYARTLADWRKLFFEKIHHIKDLGYPESFIRMWDYYFCYCEGGFKEADIGTAQILFVKDHG